MKTVAMADEALDASARHMLESIQRILGTRHDLHREPWIFVFFVLLQFHVGIRMTPITQARTGMFDPLKAMIAIRRGVAMNVDLNDGWDYWPVMGEQVEELRRRYNILPVEVFLPAKQETIAAVT
ncbi:MAG: hypothetical protein JSS39_05370 [Nitrospira sp.]|nr:hypothetical protein [Nitrospira sp.]